MHAIKSKAKRAAWVREGDARYNPFGKFHMQSRQNSLDTQERGAARPPLGAARPSTLRPVDPSPPPDSRIEKPIPIDGQPVNGNNSYGIEGIQSSTNTTPTSSTGINPKPQTSEQHTGMKQKVLDVFHRGSKDSGKEKDQSVERTTTNESKKKKHFTVMGQLRATVFGSWVNVLLICVPVGIGLHFSNVNGIAIFVVNFLAIIPLAGLLSYSTEEISMRVGETLGGLLNASFGNAVELIVSILALADNQILIVKTSLIGSMLSNLLLVMGMCFFFGGLKRETQKFNITVAQTASSLLALATGSLIIPTIFHDWGQASTPRYRETQVPKLSHGVAIIMLIVYACYLFFQLKTHATMYNEPSEKTPKRTKAGEDANVNKDVALIGANTGAQAAGGLFIGNDVMDRNPGQENGEEVDEEEQPALSVVGAIVTLCISTAFVGWCAEYMVDGIGAVTRGGGISPEFVGLILIPIVGNAAEHATAVTVAVKDKMDLAIGVAIGSSLQIALFVLPFVVVLGWILGKTDMTLEFDGFLIGLLFVSVLLVNYLIADGQSHWLEGVLLMATYIIIAVAAYFYPESSDVVG